MKKYHRAAPLRLLIALPLALSSGAVLGKPNTARAATEATTPSLTLAQDGKAVMPIVVAPDASDATRAVAAELAGYLKRISGADFTVQTGDGHAGIVLGTLSQFPVKALVKPLEIRDRYDGLEAYAIATEANRVLLLGTTDLGASHAAFRFLDALGCRWFFPSQEWEVIPSLRTLRVSLTETSRPAVLSRNLGWSYGVLTEDTSKPKEEWRGMKDWEAWKRHNLMASPFEIYTAHAYTNIYTDNRALFDAHPEYLAFAEGRRFSGQLCLSNLNVRKLVVDYALGYFAKYPNAVMVSLEPADGAAMCECEECAKLGSISDRVFGMANEAARAVQKTYPGKMVGLLAYFQHSDPPSFDLEPNIHVQHATLYTEGQYSFNQQFEMWPEKSNNLGIYDYLSTWAWGQDRLRAVPSTGPAASIEYLKRNIPRFARTHGKSYYAESSNAWAQYGRGYYVANKLLWNPDTDVDAVLRDFYDKAFGPAAKVMQRFYERISPDSKPIFGRDLLARAYRDLAEASTLAKDRPDVQARLDDLKQYMRFNELYWLLNEAGDDKARKKELTLQLFTQSYRTRWTYMTHSAAVQSSWTPEAATEFEEPDWNYWKDAPHIPWKVAALYTHEETEREFQEGLQFFQPQEVDEKKFSGDLVPVTFPAGKAPTPAPYFPGLATGQFFQAPGRIALYSFNGEPLEWEITAVPSPANELCLLDAGEKVIAANADLIPVSTRMIGENIAVKYQVKVPAKGLYYLDVKSINWGIGFGAGQCAAITLPRERSLDSYPWGSGAVCFYVPKGTKQIQYFWSGSPHRIYNPENELVEEVKTNNENVKIPVPSGMDGKIWWIGPRFGQLWFFNCPNTVAVTPEALMIPRELAQADGLTIRR